MNQSASSRRELSRLLRAVVKVHAVSDHPNYDQPWQTHGPTTSFGSGAVVETSRGLRVLTNAHCVADHVFVEVRRYDHAQKYIAEVEAIGHECDLALLQVEERSFFSDIEPLAIGPLPSLGDKVSVCGYPIGGDRMSISRGIVSRIELVNYAQSQRSLLAVQIDAAINAGNSGGPVLRGGALSGVAFQALDDAEQIGYMIATPVIEHFLADIDAGGYRGFPSLGVTTQTLESEALRRSLGLSGRELGGMLVSEVAFGGSADDKLRRGDVLLEMEGVPIEADGTVMLREGELINFEYLISRHFIGECVHLNIWRDGERQDVAIELRPPVDLVDEQRYEVKPSYFIVGGLLFVPLTRDYLGTWGEGWWQSAPRDLVALYENGLPTGERQQPVVLQKVLADRINQGYHDMESLLIESVDGTPVRSLRHLAQLVEEHDGCYCSFEASDGTRIVLDRAQARQRQEKILKRFGVPHDRSPDLRPERS